MKYLISTLLLLIVLFTNAQPVTTIEQVIYDMAGEPFRSKSFTIWGKHEGVLEDGITQFSGYDWYEGARPGSWIYPGIISGQYKGINTWGELYPEKDYIKNGGTLNFRVQIRNLRVYALLSGKWDLIIDTPNPDVNTGWSNYTYGFGSAPKTSNAREETNNGGGISITLPNNAIIHWWDSYWPRQQMPFDAEAVVSYAEIRLIPDTDPTINLDNVKVLAAEGIDTYTSTTSVSSGEPVTSAGLPRHKYVTSQWKSFTMYVVGNPVPETYEEYRNLILSKPYPPFVSNSISGSITSPANNAYYIAGDTVRIFTSVNDLSGAVSKVEFLLDGKKIATDTIAPYEAIIETIQKGDYEIASVIYDIENNKFITSPVKIGVTASLPPKVSIVSPADGSFFSQNLVNTEIKISASDDDGTISKIEIYDGDSLLTTIESEPYVYMWENITEGIHQIHAVATDNSETSSKSELVSFTVGNCGNGNSYIANQEFDFGIAGWGLWNNTDNKSKMTVDNQSILSGANSVKIDVAETNNLSNVILYKKFNFVKGRQYKICFMAKASTPKKMEVTLQEKGPDWSEKWTETVDVDTIARSFGPYYYQSVNDYYNGDIKFHVGGTTGQIWIDKVMVVDSREIVLSLPKVEIIEPLENTNFQVGKTITIEVSASDSLGVISKVAFYNNEEFLGFDSIPPFKYFFEDAVTGKYNVKAIAINDNNLQTESKIVSFSVGQITSTEFIELKGISIYPNPVNNATFTISTNGLISNGHLTISNILGQIVLEKDIQNQSNILINTESLINTGLYFVQVSGNHKTFVKKIIVE